jgi:hypothetical protein
MMKRRVLAASALSFVLVPARPCAKIQDGNASAS